MSQHPLNLTFRFALEVGAIVLTVYWGWTYFEGPIKLGTAILIPLLLMTLWGGFRYPKDHGKGFAKVSGRTRIALEVFVLATPVVLNVAYGNLLVPFLFSVLVICHYLLSQDRLKKLINDRK